jgi:hypothetical protein
MVEQSKQRSTFQLITNLSGEGNMFIIPKAFIQITKSYEISLFLSQLLYWSDKGKRSDGYIYKTMQEWQDELMMSEYSLNKSRKYLKEHGILKEKILKANGNPTVHYKVDAEALLLWFSTFSPKSNNSNSQETN